MNRPPDDEYGSLGDLFGSSDDEEPLSEDPLSEDDATSTSPADPAPSGARENDISLPPGLPPEYVEAFRRGYERARRGEDAEPTVVVGDVHQVDEVAAERAGAVASPAQDLPPQAAPAYTEEGGAGGLAEGSPEASGEERPPMPWRSLAVFGGVALLLVLGAFGLGRLFAGDDTASVSAGGSSPSSSASAGETPSVYEGAVRAVAVTGSRATCQAPSSVDAAGNPFTYEPDKAHDADLTSAWRCAGSGRGERLVLTLPAGTVVAEVGLVPGYAKTDPASGADRYAENNRITRVRWRFDDGSTYVQRMSGAADDRSMRTRRIPETETTTVVIQILRSEPGPRGMIAISEVRIASPRA